MLRGRNNTELQNISDESFICFANPSLSLKSSIFINLFVFLDKNSIIADKELPYIYFADRSAQH